MQRNPVPRPGEPALWTFLSAYGWDGGRRVIGRNEGLRVMAWQVMWNRKAGGPKQWTPEEVRRLRELSRRGVTLRDLSGALKRSPEAILHRARSYGIVVRRE